jgi:hypothetical protein
VRERERERERERADLPVAAGVEADHVACHPRRQQEHPPAPRGPPPRSQARALSLPPLSLCLSSSVSLPPPSHPSLSPLECLEADGAFGAVCAPGAALLSLSLPNSVKDLTESFRSSVSPIRLIPAPIPGTPAPLRAMHQLSPDALRQAKERNPQAAL